MLLQLLLFAVWLLLLLVANVVDDDEDDDDDNNVEELAVAAALADVEDKDIVAAPAIAVIADGVGVGDAEPLRDDEEKDLNILCLFLFNNGISVES